MPVRKQKKSWQNVTGRFYSNRLRRHVQFDSMLERDFILLLDIHPSVQWFTEQPMRIRFVDAEGAHQIYVPDFQVSFTEGLFLGRRVARPWIVETKYRRDLRENWKRIKPKLRAAIHEAERLHSAFHVVTESRLSGPPVANAKLLRRFTNADIRPDILASLLNNLRRVERTTVGEFVSSASENVRSEIREQVLWSAVARGLVLADIEQPIGMGTHVWLR
jgi:hypothetical protein